MILVCTFGFAVIKTISLMKTNWLILHHLAIQVISQLFEEDAAEVCRPSSGPFAKMTFVASRGPAASGT